MARTRLTGPVGIGRRATPNQLALLRDTDIRIPGNPAGWVQLYVFAAHQAVAGEDDVTGAALTGDSSALRVRAENRVASMTAQLRGAQIQASNTATSAGGSMQGVSVEALCQGVSIGTVRGAEIIVDNTTGTGTITTMVGARVRVIGAGTVTAAYGIQIVNDSATALAAPHVLDAYIRMESTGGSVPVLIDATTAPLTLHDTDRVDLIKFLAADGVTVKTMSYDTSGNALVFS